MQSGLRLENQLLAVVDVVRQLDVLFGVGLRADILDQREIGDLVVLRVGEVATDEMAGGVLVGADQLERAPVLEAAAEPKRALPELRAVDAARDRVVGVCVHVVDAAVGIDLPDDPTWPLTS